MPMINSTMSILSPISLGLALGAAAMAQSPGPVTVSPGQPNRFAAVRGSCPTFSWGLVEGASQYEIEVFRVDEQWGEPIGTSVSSLRLGSATSWTPDAEDCLEPGWTYAWFVRAEVDGELTEWSQARLLEVSAAPTADEVASAREVLARFLEGEGVGGVLGGDGGDRGRTAALGFEPMAPAQRSRTAASRAVDPAVVGQVLAASLGGTAAIRGRSTAVSGDANGVVGISSSPDGAGVVAAGAGAGVDLVLDGSTSAQTDTLLSQGGIDRSSGSLETFTIENSGGGGLAVDIAGAVTADSFAGDGSALSGVSVDDIECAGCVGATDLAANSVTGSNVVTGSLSGIDILDNSITSADIGTSAVGASEIATNAVGASEIASNAVGASEIASSAVGASEIATDAVGYSEFKPVRVVSMECNGSCSETDSTLSLICGSGYSAIAVDCAEVDSDAVDSPVACGGNNVCVRRTISDSNPIGFYCDDRSGWDAQVYCLRD